MEYIQLMNHTLSTKIHVTIILEKCNASQEEKLIMFHVHLLCIFIDM